MESHSAFFEASAQVIPVLLLAILLERRFEEEPKGAGAGLSVLLWLVIAEWVALRAIYRGQAGSGDAVIVAGGLVLAAVAIVYEPARRLLANMRRDRRRPDWMPDAVVVVITLGLLLFFVITR